MRWNPKDNMILFGVLLFSMAIAIESWAVAVFASAVWAISMLSERGEVLNNFVYGFAIRWRRRSMVQSPVSGIDPLKDQPAFVRQPYYRRRVATGRLKVVPTANGVVR